MKVQLFRDDGLVTLRFEPAVYVSAGYGTSVVLTDKEYALLQSAQCKDDEEQAAETGDATTLGKDADIDPSYEEVIDLVTSMLDDPKTDERKTEAWLDA